MCELPYERAAMNGEPLPDNITSEADKLCYYGLELLYRLYHFGKIDRDDAKKRKQAMLYELDKAKRMDQFNQKLAFHMADAIRESEMAITTFCKRRETFLSQPSRENMKELVELMDRVDLALSPRLQINNETDNGG